MVNLVSARDFFYSLDYRSGLQIISSDNRFPPPKKKSIIFWQEVNNKQ